MMDTVRAMQCGDNALLLDMKKLLEQTPFVSQSRVVYRTIDAKDAEWRSDVIELETNRNAVRSARGEMPLAVRTRFKISPTGDCAAGTLDPSMCPLDVQSIGIFPQRVEFLKARTPREELESSFTGPCNELRNAVKRAAVSDAHDTIVSVLPLAGSLIRVACGRMPASRIVYDMQDRTVRVRLYLHKMVSVVDSKQVLDDATRSRRSFMVVKHVIYFGCEFVDEVPAEPEQEVEPAHDAVTDASTRTLADLVRKRQFSPDRDRTRRERK